MAGSARAAVFLHNECVNLRSRIKTILALVAGIVIAATAIAGPAQASGSIRPAADLSQFSPGNIISDQVFFNSGTMSESDIDSFLRQKGSACERGYTCLRDFRQNTSTKSADSYCSGYSGSANEPAARIILKVATSCGINPQVLITTLQKEQALVTHPSPSESRYRIAMGQGCPDTAACDTRYYGFQNQVYGAARQFKIYAEGRYFTYYAPGRTWNILFNPDRGCGSSPVYVSNTATAALYYYTPYQPNAAALRAGYGEGDGCSSYGNRNFYQYFTDWFGSTAYKVEGGLADFWRSNGAGSGWIGEPSSSSRLWTVDGTRGWSQRFDGADLYEPPGQQPVRATIGGTRDEYRLVGEVASGLRWPTGPVLSARGGWYQDFQGGRIYVRPADGAGFAVAAPINSVYERSGNIGGWLGWPSSRAYRFADGARQDFAGGSIFQGPSTTVALDRESTDAFIAAGGPSRLGWPSKVQTDAANTIISLSRAVLVRGRNGNLVVDGSTYSAYLAAGGTSGVLGLPTANERTDGQGRRQDFAGGSIYTSDAGSFVVARLKDALRKQGGVAALGYPTGPQSGTGSSLSQDFVKATLTSSAKGTFLVRGAIGGAYRGMGGASSYLGAAVESERAIGDGYVQRFEGGTIYCSSLATVAVPTPVAQRYHSAGGYSGRLGWPVTAAVSTAAGWSQGFQGGEVATDRKGSVGAVIVGATLNTYRIAGGAAVLGVPRANEVESAAGWSQRFQRGIVFVPRAGSASAVANAEFKAYTSIGGDKNLGFATGPAASVDGVVQQPFQLGRLYRIGETSYATRGYINTHYQALGGVRSALGTPRGNEYATNGGHRQDFVGGSILVSKTGAFTTRGALGAEYMRRGGEKGSLGWPVGDETSSPGRWQQRFQKGTLVLFANGTYAVQ